MSASLASLRRSSRADSAAVAVSDGGGEDRHCTTRCESRGITPDGICVLRPEECAVEAWPRGVRLEAFEVTDPARSRFRGIMKAIAL